MNKIQKITKGKRDFFSPKGRQVDDLGLDRIKSILADLEIRRDLLIEALHKVQMALKYAPNQIPAIRLRDDLRRVLGR